MWWELCNVIVELEAVSAVLVHVCGSRRNCQAGISQGDIRNIRWSRLGVAGSFVNNKQQRVGEEEES